MQRYFLKLAYNGTDFHGWQIQPNANTIQEEIINALTKINGNKPVEVVGCGRTDTGVHATVFYAHFDFVTEYSENDLSFKLNNMLPRTIVIYKVIKVASDAHARFDATSRTYHYFISREKSAFRFNESYFFNQQLNLEQMNKACEFLLKHEDFTSFSKLHTDTFTNNCNISKAIWSHSEDGYQFEITADRFLRNMVRAIVGSCLEVGLGKMSPEKFNEVILAKDRNKAGRSVPGCGLFLADVTYPYL